MLAPAISLPAWPVSRTVSPFPGPQGFRLCSGLRLSLGPRDGWEVGRGRGRSPGPHRRVFAVQEPRAGRPEAWEAKSILHSGAQGGSSWTHKMRISCYQVQGGGAACTHFLSLLWQIAADSGAGDNIPSHGSGIPQAEMGLAGGGIKVSARLVPSGGPKGESFFAFSSL